MADPVVQNRLPDNAYRELKPGESYVPMVPPGVTVAEVTMRSILFGIAMNIVFSMAATYLALKVGQGIETAIPISILAVGLSGFLLRTGGRRSTIIENVNILAISTTSGIVAGGTCFTMPAIYLLKLNEKLNLQGFPLFMQIFLVPFLGAILGVIFLVPFRRYFVKDMHGKLPFPEATATNEILVTGQGGAGGGAWVLIYSFIGAAVYTFLASGVKLWRETFTTGGFTLEFFKRAPEEAGDAAGAAAQAVAPAEAAEAAGAISKWIENKVDMLAFPSLQHITEKIKVVASCNTGAEFLGLGFIIGVRYASIICAGSFLSWFVIIPLLAPLSLESLQLLNAGVKGTSAEAIFGAIPKNIGIGCIFTAGVLSILKMSKVIVTALREAVGSLFRGGATGATHDRTDDDISYPALFGLGILTTIAIAIYFRFFVLNTMPNANWLTLVSVLLALGVSFVFITVSAWAIATISVTPISGMTVTTIIITAVVLLAAGLQKGDAGMLAVLLVGGVVASALSMAGTLVTEFKIGYWTGASPKRIQWSAIIASLLASAVVTGTIMVLAKSPGYDPTIKPSALQAPQANLMKSALESFIGTGAVPWLMYGVGVAVALLMELVKVSPLAFGLGMYLPMELNVPILIGALFGAAIKRGTSDQQLIKARGDKSVLVASGLIAGSAITGVILRGFDAAAPDFMHMININGHLIDGARTPEHVGRIGNWLGMVAFLVLCIVTFVDCRRAKASDAIGEAQIGH